jgi:AcrR family transcriptional regulator
MAKAQRQKRRQQVKAAAARPPAAPARPKRARKAGRSRKVAPEVRRGAILKAALAVFAERGFAAARLDDVAARAGVAKGTLYLYFQSKEDLFEALIRTAVSPVLAQVGKMAAAPDMPPTRALEAFFALFETEVLGSDRKLLLRLIISEGARFPALAEIYYREVVSRGLELMGGLARRAAQDGTFATAAPARYPQLIVAPLLLAVIWDALFAKVDPLDVAGFLRSHLEVLTGKKRKGSI